MKPTTMAATTVTGRGHHGRARLIWRPVDGGHGLCLGRGRTLAHVLPDFAHPGMWRVHLNGRVSDMANLIWAKERATRIVLRDLNCLVQETAGERPLTATEALPVVESPDTPAAVPDAPEARRGSEEEIKWRTI